MNALNKSKNDSVSISPDRTKSAAAPELTKQSEPVKKQTSLFGSKKNPLNPFVRKPSQEKKLDENVNSNSQLKGIGSGFGQGSSGSGLLGNQN